MMKSAREDALSSAFNAGKAIVGERDEAVGVRVAYHLPFMVPGTSEHPNIRT
jgi:hypothetical protein